MQNPEIERCNRHLREFRRVDGCPECSRQKQEVVRFVNAVRFAEIAGDAEEKANGTL